MFRKQDSIMNQQMNAILRPFERMVDQVFQNFPEKQSQSKIENVIYDYISQITVIDSDIKKIIHNASFVASSQPDTSLSNLVSLLPNLNINEKGNPTLTFFKNMRDIDWEDLYQRSTFQYLVDSLICSFLYNLLVVSTEITKEECHNIFNLIMESWYPKNPHPPFYERLRLINGKVWSDILYILSSKIPEEVANDLLIKRMPQQNNTDISIQIYLTLSQCIYIGNDSKLDYDSLPKKFNDLESIAKRSTKGQIHVQSMSFFTNLMGNLLVCHPEYREHPFIFNLSEIAKNCTKERNYIGTAYTLRALLYRFTKHKRMKNTLKEYYDKYIEKKFTPELAPYHIESCIYFVRGENYASQCQLDISQENYKWRYDKKEKEMISYLFKNITEAHNDIYQKAQEQLGEFFTQIACNDFKEFVSEYLPKIIDNSFASNNVLSLYIMAHNILSPMSKFKEYAKNGDDDKSIAKMKKWILKLVKSDIDLSHEYQNTNIGFYSIVSFIESLNLSSVKDENDESIIESKMNSCIDALPKNSFVQSSTIYTGKSINIKEQQKWIKNMVNHLGKKLFEKISLDNKIKPAEIKAPIVDKTIEAISLLPFLNIDHSIIELLINCIYTPNCHAGSIALRTLQVFVHLDMKWLDIILAALCEKMPYSAEYQLLQLQAVSLIVESGLFIHANICKDVQKLLFKTLVIGLCSNDADIRSFSLDLAAKVSILKDNKEPDLHNFLTFYSNVIEIRLQALAFSYASFNTDLDISDVETISFKSVAKSNCNNLYMFALESLSNVFRDKSNPADLDYLQSALASAVREENEMNPIVKINLYVFLAGTALTRDLHESFFMEDLERINKLLDSSKPVRSIAYASFYTAFKSEIGINIQKPLIKSDDPFILQTVAFILRVYITESTALTNYVTKTANKLLKTYKKKSNKEDWLDERIESLQTNDVLDQQSLLFNTEDDWPLITEENKEFITSLYHFLITLKFLYREKFKEMASLPNGPYARPQRISFELDSMPDKKDTLAFAFLTNLSSIEDDTGLRYDLISLAKSSLDAFIKIYIIPSAITNLLRRNLIKISKISLTFIEMILNSFFIDLIPQYIHNSFTNPDFFKAISRQFYQTDSMNQYCDTWTKALNGKMSEQDNYFATVSYLNTGVLLAFAFINMCSFNPDERVNGFNILINVLLGSSLVSSRSNDGVELLSKTDISDFHELIHSLARLKTLISVQHPQLTENLLLKISTFAKKELEFCTEQFIKTSFELIKQQFCQEDKIQIEVFLHLVVPWIDNFLFNRIEDTILKDCDKDFSCLSTFSFFQMLVENVITIPLNRSHVILIDKIMKQPCDGDISTLDFFLITLYKLYQLHVQVVNEINRKTLSRKESRLNAYVIHEQDETGRKIIAIMVYLLGQNKEEVINIISKYVSFKAWFYYQIQLKKNETAFDIDEFIQEIVSKDEKKNRQSNESSPKMKDSPASNGFNESDENIYETIVDFTVDIFLEFIKVNKESIESVDYQLVLFSMLNYETFNKNKKILQLLSDICGIETSSFSGVIRAFSSMFSNISLGSSDNEKVVSTEPIMNIPSFMRKSDIKIRSNQFDEIDYASDSVGLIENLTGVPIQNSITALEYIGDLNPEHLQLFCDEALRWAVCCGDINIATRAAKFFLIYMKKADEDIIHIIIRSIFIVNTIMSERVDPSYKINAGILAAIQDNQQPDYAKSIQYMAILLNILNKCHDLMKKPNEDTFYVALSFLQFKESIQMPLVTVALKIIISYLETEKQFISKIMSKSGEMPNFLRPLIGMNHTETTLELSFKLISILATEYPKTLIEDDNDKFFNTSTVKMSTTSSLLRSKTTAQLTYFSDDQGNKSRDSIDSKSGLSLLVLALMPYAFTYQHDAKVKDMMNSLSSLASSKGFADLANELKSKFSGSIEVFCKSIMSKLAKMKIVSSDISLAVKFFTSISYSSVSTKASASLKSMFGPIVSICRILLSNPEFNAPVSLFSDIGHISILDKDTNRNSLNLDFLAVLTAKDGKASQSKTSKTLKVVPELKMKTLIDLSSWTPTEGVDQFENVRDYPPLSIISIDYVGCLIQKPISCAVQQIKVEPFSTWTTMMFRAEALQMQTNMNIAINKEIKVEDEKAQKILAIFENAIVIHPDESFIIEDKKNSDIESSVKNVEKKEEVQPDAASLYAVPSNLTVPYAIEEWVLRLEDKIFSPAEFVPSQSEIVNIGSEMFKDMEPLDFFPVDRF